MQLYIEQAYHKISHRSKVIFTVTAIVVFMVHGFMLSNNLICSDSLCYFYDKYDIRYSGRWFLTYAAGISSWFDLHWLNGVLSIIYISAAAVVVVKALDIQNTFLGCLAGSILGIYPTVTKTFAYMFSADAYFMAMLFSAIAAYLFIQDKWQKRLAGSVLCALSMGIYQAYLTFLLSLLILWIIRQTMRNGSITVKKIFHITYSSALGGVLYYLGLKIRLRGGSLTSYQGMDEITLFRSPIWYLRQIKKCYTEFVRNILYNNAFSNHLIMKVIFGFWLIFGILFVVMLVWQFVKQKAKRGSIAFACLAIFCLPMVSLLFYLTSDKLFYHMLMKESIALCWILPVMCIDQALFYDKGKLLREIMIGILLVVLGNTAIGNNILYLSLYTSYQKTYALENRIVYKIEEVNSEYLKCLYIHGNVDNEDYSNHDFDHVDIDSLATKNGIIPYVYYTHVFFINQYIGGNYQCPAGDQIADIKSSDEFAAMPIWPEEGAVRIINDVIVVKLGN